jgi:hypothetical protein
MQVAIRRQGVCAAAAAPRVPIPIGQRGSMLAWSFLLVRV